MLVVLKFTVMVTHFDSHFLPSIVFSFLSVFLVLLHFCHSFHTFLDYFLHYRISFFLCVSCFSSCSPWLFFCLYERLFCLFVCLSVSVCLPLSLEICLAPFYTLARVTFSLERRLKPTTNKTKQNFFFFFSEKNCDFPKVFNTFQCTLNQLN